MSNDEKLTLDEVKIRAAPLTRLLAKTLNDYPDKKLSVVIGALASILGEIAKKSNQPDEILEVLEETIYHSIKTQGPPKLTLVKTDTPVS